MNCKLSMPFFEDAMSDRPIIHFRSGRWLSSKMVFTVTVKVRRQSLQRYSPSRAVLPLSFAIRD